MLGALQPQARAPGRRGAAKHLPFLSKQQAVANGPLPRISHTQHVIMTLEVLPAPPLPPNVPPPPLVSPIEERACTPLRPSYTADLRDGALAAANYAQEDIVQVSQGLTMGWGCGGFAMGWGHWGVSQGGSWGRRAGGGHCAQVDIAQAWATRMGCGGHCVGCGGH